MPELGKVECLLYWIDAADCLVAVNDAWNDFAVENGAPELVREHVLGRSLWDYIADPTTKNVYHSLIARARASQPMNFAYRCDSPAMRRLMHMTITAEPGGRVRFQSLVAGRQFTSQVALWDHSRARSGHPVRACSWCKNIQIGDHHWTDPDVAVNVLGLLAIEPLPPITHGICPPCYETVKATLDM